MGEDSLIFGLSHLVCNHLAEKMEKQASKFGNITLAKKIIEGEFEII